MAATDAIDRIVQALALQGPVSSDFDLNSDIPLPEGRVLRPAGVLVALIERSGGMDMILTKRSARLKHHPGQIAFAGGKVDPTDSGPVDAALREAEEEIGLPRTMVEVLGALPVHETVTGFSITPVIGLIREPFIERAELGEVDEIFRVPLALVTDPSRFRIESRRWQGRRRYYYVVPYGPYYIWGATARILRGLADRLTR